MRWPWTTRPESDAPSPSSSTSGTELQLVRWVEEEGGDVWFGLLELIEVRSSTAATPGVVEYTHT